MPTVRDTMAQKIGVAYKDMDLTMTTLPPDDVQFDPQSFRRGCYCVHPVSAKHACTDVRELPSVLQTECGDEIQTSLVGWTNPPLGEASQHTAQPITCA
jgi:hypothetical protein